MSGIAAADKTHRWSFEKLGGVYQVSLRRGEDIGHIGELDPKVWVALSCPASGLEFDQRTLALIDSDRDGRIRIPEVAAAAAWLAGVVKNPAGGADPSAGLTLADIDDATEEGRRLARAARALLASLGKEETALITQEDVEAAIERSSERECNGDGIVPPLQSLDPEMRRFVQDALAVIGGAADASGRSGVNIAIADAFVRTLAAREAWLERVAAAETPLGPATPEAWTLAAELGPKIDDYFLRCELASYAPGTKAALNAEEKLVPAAAAAILEKESLRELPLSHIDAGRPLDLASGVNPAWRDRLERFALLTGPLLKTPGSLSREDWDAVQAAFAPYVRALADRPEPEKADVAFPPESGIESLPDGRGREILASGVPERFRRLAAEDAARPAAAADVAALERLVLYRRHLPRLLVNFVSFEDFYAMRRPASFQSGTLFIDGRACRLCMPAEKPDDHAALAARSQLFLLYCLCVKGVNPAGDGPLRTKTVVAAVTAGDSDLLSPGRKGVFVDNLGDDWDATVVKVVASPISLREAMWTPYKRFGNMMADFVAKAAGAREAGMLAAAGKKLDQAMGGAPAAPAFDITRNVGMLAAVGIALGAIGTALGSIASAFLAMEWWRFPLVFVGLFLLVSGPSTLLAWLKLRRRTLGPLLEASGWAVNSRLSLDYAMSGRLTQTARLPANSRVDHGLDIARVRRAHRAVFWLAVLAGILAVAGALAWREGRRAAAKPETADAKAGDPPGLADALRQLSDAIAPHPPTPAPAPAGAPK